MQGYVLALDGAPMAEVAVTMLKKHGDKLQRIYKLLQGKIADGCTNAAAYDDLKERESSREREREIARERE